MTDAERYDAMVRVSHVMNGRKGFHVDVLDAETRFELLGAIVDAVKEAPDGDE